MPGCREIPINEATGAGTIADDDVSQPQEPGTGDPGTGQDNTTDGASERAASLITLRIAKRSTIVAKGWLFPAHGNKRVVVKLPKKVNGSFPVVRTKRPLLGAGRDINRDGVRESKYRTSFRKPSAAVPVRGQVPRRHRPQAEHRPPHLLLLSRRSNRLGSA
jgi:hypothetical protein